MFFKTIKFKFFLSAILSIIAILFSIALAYFISTNEIRSIMINDLKTLSDALHKQILYIASINPNAHRDKAFKESIYNTKVGKSGYVYFINKEGTMVIHHKKEGKNYAGKGYIDYIRSHKSGIHEYVSATTGQDKIVAFNYIEPWKIWLIPGVNKADYFLDMKEKFLTYFSIIFLFLVALFLSINYITSRSILKPIKDLENTSEELSKHDGDLTTRLPIHKDDEISLAIIGINKFIEKVQYIIKDIKDSSVDNKNLGENLNTNSKAIKARVENEAFMIEDIKQDGDDIKTLLNSLLQKATDSKENIEISNKNLIDVKSDILNMTSQIREASELESELAGKLNQLSSDAEQVKSILTVISDIADQTNLLALNAAIEAARAGEHGRGFAVVADNVRDLAEKTQKTLADINSTINIIVQSISDSSEQMNLNAGNVEKLANISIDLENRVNETSSLIDRSLTLSNETLENTVNFSTKSRSRTEKIEAITKISIENKKEIEDMSNSIDDLQTLTTKLDSQINKFKT